MTDQVSMEELSWSYLNAVAACANIAVEREIHDDDGIDGKIKKDICRKKGDVFKSSVSFQLKATGQLLVEKEGMIHFPLKVKNYDDLRAEGTTQQVLFLFQMPSEKEEWIEQDCEALKLKKCMYWLSLANAPAKENTQTVTIKIPIKQMVTPENLEEIMQIVAEGGEL